MNVYKLQISKRKFKLDVDICDSFHLFSSYFPKAIWSTTFKLQIQYISQTVYMVQLLISLYIVVP